MMEFNFKGKTAIITGGASGMGKLSGERFAAMGANVLLVDVNEEMLNAAVEGIRAAGGNATAAVTDVRDFAQVEAAAKKAVDTYGSIDILVNCAGGASCRVNQIKEPFENFPIWALDWGIDVNLKGPLYFTRAVMGQMYGTTKSMAQYGAKFGVRANCVSPGPVLTREAMGRMKTLLGRAAEPIEVVNLITYLASDEASFITGANFMIDGGRTVMLPQ